MFTGIIEATATVLEKTATGVTIQRPATFDDIKLGSSVCIHGVCLSVIAFDDSLLRFDVVQETWNCSNLGSLEVGSIVNVERAMAANGRFDGHIVQGHVEGVGRTLHVTRSTSDTMVEIEVPDELIKYCIQKGSTTLNGVSLTISKQKSSSIKVALVPHTLENTTFGTLKAGELVNIETDILGKYVERLQR